MWHFIPDITGTTIGPYDALNQFKEVLPKGVSLTVC